MTTFDYTSAKSLDQELYETYKKTGSKQDLGRLMDQISGTIYAEVHRASGSLPTTALALEAKKWAFKAIQTYDPSKGTSLNTHINNYLPKVRRLNYKFQNAVRLPENLQLKYHEYNRHLTQLSEDLNRDPSEEELARSLGWSKPQVVKFKNSLYSDLIESASERPSEFTQFNQGAILMAHIKEQLTPDEMFIWENNKVMPSTEIAAKLGVNLNRYNYLKAKLTEKVMKIKTDIGM